jgi:hypothetical protein
MRLAASKLYQHLRDLVLERRLVHAIVGALTQHERLDHRPQRVWLQIVGRHSDGSDLPGAGLPFKFDGEVALVLHVSQRYTMAVAHVALATREHGVSGFCVDGPVAWRTRELCDVLATIA